MTKSTTDVLIIGGGPTGTALALELAVNNITFRLVDKARCRSDKSRALAVQPRTLELLNRHGHVHELIKRGNQGSGGTFFIHGKRVVDLDFSNAHAGADTVFPNTLMISQSDTEHFLDERLAQHGGAVEFGLEATDIVQDDDGVTVSLRNVEEAKDDGETIRAKYVVGADGAHSAVRHAAKDITFDGAAYPQDFILCDTHIRNSILPWNRFSVCWGHGTMVVFPLKDGMVRIVASRLDHSANDEEEPKLQDFQSWLDYMTPGGGELYDPSWLARFRLHHRVASKYHQGRLFVAGDAAHIHSPAGGQGMNTGIQDAVNLGWKLARVIHGTKPDSLLDSYTAERRPVGQRLLNTSDYLFSWVASTNRVWMFFRNLLVPWLLPRLYGDATRRVRMFRFLSQLGVRYRRSPIVGTASGFTGPILGGNRAPDGPIESDGKQQQLHGLFTAERHHLILFSGLESSALPTEGDLQRAELNFKDRNPDDAAVHVIYGQPPNGQSGYIDSTGRLHKCYGFERTPGYVYVRPDGYVAHTGPLGAIQEFMAWLEQDMRC